MKEDYIRQVQKKLILPGKKKQAIIRDLQEAFESGAEHGESEDQVIRRLGSPEEFAAGIHEQLGIHPELKRKKKRLIAMGISFVIAFGAFLLLAVIRMSMPPQNAIGGADAMTSIQVVRTMPDPTLLLAIIGIGALITAIVFAVLSRRK